MTKSKKTFDPLELLRAQMKVPRPRKKHLPIERRFLARIKCWDWGYTLQTNSDYSHSNLKFSEGFVISLVCVVERPLAWRGRSLTFNLIGSPLADPTAERDVGDILEPRGRLETVKGGYAGHVWIPTLSFGPLLQMFIGGRFRWLSVSTSLFVGGHAPIYQMYLEATVDETDYTE